MFQVNDAIMYGTQGVCKIVDITIKDFMGEKREYYVLRPLSKDSSTIFAPKNHGKTDGKMRRILTGQEVHELIQGMPLEKSVWIINDNERKEYYKQVVMSGNHIELIRMIKTLQKQKREREADGKHLYISDEKFLREAERILYEEFQYVLDINREELMALITKKIEDCN